MAEAVGRRGPLRHAGDALAVAGMVALGAGCLHRYADGFDSLSYHLPFAALRTGLLTPADFVLPPLLADRFAGFPPLADWVQGGLWRLFGVPEAAALIGPLAVLGFAAYGRAAFAVPLLWSVLIFLAVPILHVALDGMYVDLWSNAAFAVHLLAAWRAATPPPQAGHRRIAGHALVAMAALAVAVWSKPQFGVLGAVSWALFLLLLLRLARRGRPVGWALAAVGVLAPVAFLWPLRNLAVFGNPLWPVIVQLGPVTLPGTEHVAYVVPADLRHAANPLRYLLSLLELDGLNARRGGYTIDQGVQPDGAPGDRMGGSLSVLLLAATAALGIGAARLRWTADAAAAAGAMLLLVAVVACLPGANELRYVSFVEILSVFAALAALRRCAEAGDAYAAGLLTGLQSVLVGAALFIGFVTGGVHLFSHRPTLHARARAEAAQDGLAAALTRSGVACLVDANYRGLLIAPLLDPLPQGGVWRVAEARSAEGCPPGSAVLVAGP